MLTYRNRIIRGDALTVLNKGQFIKGSHWRQPKPYWDKAWLLNEYISKGKSAANIAGEMGCTENNILYWINKHEIPTRKMSEIRKIKHWGAPGNKNPMFRKTGEQNPHWKGGLSPERQTQYSRSDWKELYKLILKRDGYECKKCGEGHRAGHKLYVHHIKHWAKHPNLRFDAANLITLCENCHKKEHVKI